jgi:protein-tyrosine-phosphatase
MNVLFVGRADTGLTPIAGALLRDRLCRDARADVEVSTAGLDAVPGSPAVDAAAARALEEGIDLSGHRSRRLDPSLLAWAGLVVALEEPLERRIQDLAGSAAAPCRLLAQHGPDLAEAGDWAALDPGGEASWRCLLGRLRSSIEALYRDLPAAAPEVYARAVEHLFSGRTGATLSLAPADWDQIERWWSAGVPLWIVLDSLRASMHRTARRGDAGRMRRLRYCAPDVQDRFAAWNRSRGGAEPPAPPPCDGSLPGAGVARTDGEPADLLRERAAVVLREALAGARAREEGPLAGLLEAALRDVQEAPRAEDLSEERLRLHAIDEWIADRLPAAVEAAALVAERAEAEARLAAHRDRMTRDAFDRTVQRLLQRRLRERLGVAGLPV